MLLVLQALLPVRPTICEVQQQLFLNTTGGQCGMSIMVATCGTKSSFTEINVHEQVRLHS